MVHAAASAGFELAADAYDRARPEYPEEAIAWLWRALGLEAGSRIADVGAGTGKLTAPLVARGAVVVAIEPVDAMRERLERLIPEAAAFAATAEELPLDSDSVAAVVAGQAFHWFANNRSLAEFDRVLGSDGCLGLIWNRRQLDDPMQAAISALIEPYSEDVPRHASDAWRAVLSESPLFEPAGSLELGFAQALDADGLVDRVGSTSFLAPQDRKPLLDRVRSLAEGRESVELSYVCEAFAFTRRS